MMAAKIRASRTPTLHFPRLRRPLPTDAVADDPNPFACADDPTWCYGDCDPNDCNYVAAKPKRCKATDTEGVSALQACPVACGTCNPGAVSAASLEDVTGLDTDATPPPSLADCDLTVQGCNPLIPDFDGAATLSISLSVLVVAAALTP